MLEVSLSRLKAENEKKGHCSPSGSAARDNTIEIESSFQQLSQDTTGPAHRLLGLLMTPPVPAGVAGVYMSQIAFKTRGYTAPKLQGPTAKQGRTTA